MAAEKESAVVFPPFYFGQIYEARCFPGAVTIRPTLLMELVEGVWDEIGRNGFKKIILYNGHGGNIHFVYFLVQCTLWKEKDYSVYYPTDLLSKERREAWRRLTETQRHVHACECETSVTLAGYPELVDMGSVPPEPALPKRRLAHLPSTYTGVTWYSDYPEHYAGDARPASAGKGRALRQLTVDALAEYIAAVKKDQAVPALSGEFHARARALRD